MAAGSARAGTIEVIVLRDDPVPGGTGVFETFQLPVINAAGTIAFRAGLSETPGGSADNSGIWRFEDGAMIQIVRKGQPTPQGTGNYSGFGEAAIDPDGEVHFSAGTTGFFSSGLFRTAQGAIVQILVEGDPVPGGSGSIINFTPPRPGQPGTSTVRASVTGGQALLRADARGSLETIARTGDPAPGGDFYQSNFSRPLMAPDGRLVFGAALVAANPPPFLLGGIFLDDGFSVEAVVRTGDPLPSGPGTFNFGGLPAPPALAEGGVVAFSASALAGTPGGTLDNAGIFRFDDRGLVEIARRGAATPSGNGVFLSFAAPVAVNTAGQVLFVASLTGTSAGSLDDSGLFLGDGERLLEVAREGDSAPGGGTYGAFPVNLIDPMDIDAAGTVVFLTTMSDFDDAIVRWTEEDGATLVARDGQALAGGTIHSLGFAGAAAPHLDESRGINDAGQVAFRFTTVPGNRPGIAVWSAAPPPVPGDLDGDGVVGGADLGLLLAAWGSADPGADLDGSGVVDGADLGMLLALWTR